MIEKALQHARAAYLALSKTSTMHRNDLLLRIRDALIAKREAIESANLEDLEESKGLEAKGVLAHALVERLALHGSKFGSLMGMVESVSKIEDPLNIVTYCHNMIDDGSLSVNRVSCPIGVIAVIFESRPEAAVQIAALCIKSGNAVVLKCGKEARRTCKALVDAMREVAGDAIHLFETREEMQQLLSMDKLVDLVIPRGGRDLVKYCKSNTLIPVLGHADGICSVYVDKEADIEMARRIIVDAKTQYPAVCNAAETLLVHADMSDRIIDLVQPLIERKVQIRACDQSFNLLEILGDSVVRANPSDFSTEFCDLILAVKIVESTHAAIDHINTFGSHHSDAIVTMNAITAETFFQSVDSADVMWNASTRFADGNRFGFGAEVGVSTNKIHARGPVGLEGLTTYKYRIYGNGNTVGADGPRLVPLASPANRKRLEDIVRL